MKELNSNDKIDQNEELTKINNKNNKSSLITFAKLNKLLLIPLSLEMQFLIFYLLFWKSILMKLM